MSLSFWSELSGLERTQLRHLALIRPQAPSPSQVRFLEGLCQTLRSPRLLALIARTPHWLAEGGILAALAGNSCTPASLRGGLQQAMAVIDLLRDLNRAVQASHPKDERARVEAAIRDAFKATPPEFQPVVRAIARHLASSSKALSLGQEGPALPAAPPDWEALMRLPPEEAHPPVTVEEEAPALQERQANRIPAAERAPEQTAPQALPPELSREQKKWLDRLWGDDAELRRNALMSPVLTRELLARTLPQCANPETLEEIYLEPRWQFLEDVRAAIRRSPCCPEGISKRMDATERLLEGITTDAEDGLGIDPVQALLGQLEEPEYLYVAFKVQAKYPHLLDVIKKAYLERESLLHLPAAESEARWTALNEKAEVARLVFR